MGIHHVSHIMVAFIVSCRVALVILSISQNFLMVRGIFSMPVAPRKRPYIRERTLCVR